MSRSLLLVLRFCIVASAVAMVILCARAVHAQDAGNQNAGNQNAGVQNSEQVYGFNPGQGSPPNQDTPASAASSAVPAAGGGYTAAPQIPYGYNATDFSPAAPQQPQQPTQQTVAQQQPSSGIGPAAYGYQTGHGPAGPPTNYGTQAPSNAQAYYQPPDNGMGRGNAGYQLGAGDKIRVTVFGETDLSGEYEVDGSGVVRLPLIGTVRAIGYTAPALETSIAAALAQGYLKNPRVNVEIITYRPFYIIGAVNKPGEYPYVDNMSAMNAVALAGGFTDSAKSSTVYVRHEGSTVEEEVPTDQITHIRPGDVVRVKTTLFWDAMSVFSPLAGPAAIAAATIR